MSTSNALLNDTKVQFTYKEETWIHNLGRVSLEKFHKSDKE